MLHPSISEIIAVDAGFKKSLHYMSELKEEQCQYLLMDMFLVPASKYQSCVIYVLRRFD